MEAGRKRLVGDIVRQSLKTMGALPLLVVSSVMTVIWWLCLRLILS